MRGTSSISSSLSAAAQGGDFIFSAAGCCSETSDFDWFSTGGVSEVTGVIVEAGLSLAEGSHRGDVVLSGVVPIGFAAKKAAGSEAALSAEYAVRTLS